VRHLPFRRRNVEPPQPFLQILAAVPDHMRRNASFASITRPSRSQITMPMMFESTRRRILR
jgi:hypothetical protein